MTGSGSAAFAAAGVLLGGTAFVWLYVTGFLRRGRRQANAVDATITEADVSHDLLPDGGAAVRRRYVVEVVNQGDRPVHDVVIECFVGRAAAKKVAFGNQLMFHVWRTLAAGEEGAPWSPEFTLPSKDARLLSGRRPPPLQLEFTDSHGRAWRRDQYGRLNRWKRTSSTRKSRARA